MGDIEITRNTFNLRRIFKDKGARVTRWIPGIVWAYLNKKLRIHDLNDFLYKNKDKMGLEMVDAAIERLGVKFEVVGLENIDNTGRFTVAANHPLGGPEGLGLMHIVGKIRKDFTFLSNDILMTVPNLKMLFTPVNKHGSNTDYVDLFNESFKSDKMVLIFPAGLVSRKQDGEIRDLIWKSSFIRRSVKYDRSIVPVFIGGKNSWWFYQLGVIRKKLKLKVNLEMFLLPEEMFKQSGKTIKVIFGKPVDSSMFDGRMNYHRWSGLFKDYVYKLKDDPNLLFDESYIQSVMAKP